MTVTATFQPTSLEATAGVPATLALCVHNDSETEQIVRLKAIGELAQHTVPQSETIYLEPGEEFEVLVLVDIGNALPAGNHASQIEAATPEQNLLTAEATISVVASSTYSVSLAPINRILLLC
tara:strand:- start:75 stop:443 length:369 start_codon:yes stop_codon:yes gene_type:complete